MMNIVWQLVSGANMDFEDIYQCTPWLEFKASRETTNAERVKAINEKAGVNGYRAWKSHMPAPPLVFKDSIKYVIVIRDPADVNMSWFHFLRAHNPEFLKYWEVDVDKLLPRPNDAIGMLEKGPMLYPFIANWLGHREKKNVLLLHFADLLKDLRGEMGKVRDFLGTKLSDQVFDQCVFNATFAEMKKNEYKYEAHTIGPIVNGQIVSPLQSGSLIRKGVSGEGKAIFSAEELSRIDEILAQFVPNAADRQWVRNGSKKSS